MGERLHNQPDSYQHVYRRVRAHVGRVAYGGLDAIRVADPVEVDQVEMLAESQNCHNGPDREVGGEQHPPARESSEDRGGNNHKAEPVGQIENALHPLVGGPHASHGADAGKRGEDGNQQPQPDRRYDPRSPKTILGVIKYENQPEDKRNLDYRPGVDCLPHHKREVGAGANDQRREEDKQNPGPHGPEQKLGGSGFIGRSGLLTGHVAASMSGWITGLGPEWASTGP